MDQGLLGRRHEIILAVLLQPQHRGKKLDQRLSADRTILVVPGAVASDFQANIPTLLRCAASGRNGFAGGLAQCRQHALFVWSWHLERVLAALLTKLSSRVAECLRQTKHYCDQLLIQSIPILAPFRPIVPSSSPISSQTEPMVTLASTETQLLDCIDEIGAKI